MKKILIVDDEKNMRQLYEEIICRKLSFDHVSFAADGLDAYVECALQRFDIIILDHILPHLKGGDLLNALRNKEGPNQYTPVIIISTDTTEINELGHSMENTLLLSKPFDQQRLVRYVKMALSRCNALPKQPSFDL